MSHATDIAPLLAYLKVQGDLLEPVPPGWTGADITRRTHDEVHECIRCGERAQVAYVAETNAGDRWLDLCARDAYEARRAVERPEYTPAWRPE